MSTAPQPRLLPRPPPAVARRTSRQPPGAVGKRRATVDFSLPALRPRSSASSPRVSPGGLGRESEQPRAGGGGAKPTQAHRGYFELREGGLLFSLWGKGRDGGLRDFACAFAGGPDWWKARRSAFVARGPLLCCKSGTATRPGGFPTSLLPQRSRGRGRGRAGGGAAPHGPGRNTAGRAAFGGGERSGAGARNLFKPSPALAACGRAGFVGVKTTGCHAAAPAVSVPPPLSQRVAGIESVGAAGAR